MADVTVTLGAKDQGLKTALGKAQSAVTALKPVMLGVAAAGAAAFAALGIAAAGVKKALDMGGVLSDVAGQTGLTAGKVMLLRTAFDQAGIGADQVGTTINKMQRSLADASSGTGPAAEALARLGLSASELSGMSPDKAFKAIGGALSGIANPTERAAAAMDIFGRSGGKLLTLFGDSGALATAGDTLGGQAAIMDKNAAVFDRVSDLMNASSTKLQGVFVGMAESIAPAILPLLEQFNKMDFTALGQQIGSAASLFIQAMTDGSIWSIIGDSLKISLGNAANFLFRSLSGIINSIARLIPEIVQNAVTLFGMVTKADFWKGMLQALLGAAQAFGAKLLGLMSQSLGLFSKIPGLAGMLEGPMKAVENASTSLQGQADQNLAAGGDTLTPFFNEARERINASLSAAGQGFMEGFDGAGDVFDLSGVQANLDGTFDRLGNTVESLKAQALAALPAPNSPGGLASAFGAIEERTSGAGEPLGAKSQATNQPLFASSLAKIGGGGGIAGAPGLLDESKKQSNILQSLADVSKSVLPEISNRLAGIFSDTPREIPAQRLQAPEVPSLKAPSLQALQIPPMEPLPIIPPPAIEPSKALGGFDLQGRLDQSNVKGAFEKDRISSALYQEARLQTQFLRQIAQRIGNLNPTPLLA